MVSLSDPPPMPRRHFLRRHHARFNGALAAMLGAIWSLMAPAHADDSWAEQVPRLKEHEHFTIDPVVDGVLIVGGAGFAGLLSLVLSTGEIRPTQPGSPDRLLAIDKVAVTQTIDPNAGTYSNLGLWSAYGYAVIDTILSGARDGRRAALVDGIMYAESIAITQALTGATKIGVRRPRPIDYANCANPDVALTSCDDTDLQLSFFSGHAAATGAVTATATYLAFVRSPSGSARPWITLAAGTALTAFVSYERVRSGAHFPTDVIMGSMAGAAIGVLVPHFHRRPHFHDGHYDAPPVWIGYQPATHAPGTITVGGHF